MYTLACAGMQQHPAEICTYLFPCMYVCIYMYIFIYAYIHEPLPVNVQVCCTNFADARIYTSHTTESYHQG